MRLVDHGIRPCDAWRLHALPIKATGIDHHRLRHGSGTVAGVKGQIGSFALYRIAQQRIAVAQQAQGLARIGVQQQFVGVETLALQRGEAAVDAVAVNRARLQAIDLHMPDIALTIPQGDARQLACAIG